MAVISQARLGDNAVSSAKISSDAVIAADIDETVAYNFSSSSSTYNSSVYKIAGISGSSSTIANITSASTLSFIGGLLVSVTQ